MGCLLFFISGGCREEPEVVPDEKRDETGALIEKQYLWKTDISEGGYVWNSMTPAIYEDKVIVTAGKENKHHYVVALDIKTGAKKWQWEGFMGEKHGQLNSGEYEFNQKDNILLLQAGEFFYSLDLGSGTTIWKQRRRGLDPYPGIFIKGDEYFYGFAPLVDAVATPSLMKGSLYSDATQIIHQPEFDSIQIYTGIYGYLGKPLIYDEGGNTHAVLQTVSHVDAYSSQQYNYVSSYNLTKGTYNFTRKRLGDIAKYHFNGRPVMYEDVIIVNAGGELWGLNKYSGEVIWNKGGYRDNGDGVFVFSIYNNNLIAVNNVGSTSRVMSLDPLTGTTNWETLDTGGNAESLHFLNDVLYFNDRGVGRIYAFDINTGKVLWNISSPDTDYFQGFGGFRVVPGKNGEKGRVIACTYLNAYCYEAEK